MRELKKVGITCIWILTITLLIGVVYPGSLRAEELVFETETETQPIESEANPEEPGISIPGEIVPDGVVASVTGDGSGESATSLALPGGGNLTFGGGSTSADNSIFTGAFTYSIPISVPPGRAGMQPRMVLNYNSQGKEGLLGMGWTLDMGSIQRNAKNGIDYGGSEFVFVSNGSARELVLFDDTTNEYRLKVDDGSFTRFMYDNVDLSWSAYSKEGKVLFFGSSNNSKLINPGNSSQVFQWLFDKVIDSNGNYMTITYSNNAGKQIIPDYVEYTGSTSVTPSKRIQFFYENRSYSSIKYIPGFPVEYGKRLRTLDIIDNDVSSVRAYHMSYSDDDLNGHTKLASVTMYGSDVEVDTQSGNIISGSVMPSVCFSYTDGGESFNNAVDGPVLYVTADKEKGLQDVNRVRTGDFNGDGITDLYRIEGNGESGGLADSIYLFYSDGSFERQDGPITYVSSWEPGATRDIARIKLGDFDGNGVTDVYRVEGYGGTVTDTIYMFNNDAQFYSVDGPDTYVSDWMPGTMRDLARIKIGDFDGNGVTDIYRVEGYGGIITDKIYLFNNDAQFYSVDGPDTYVSNWMEGTMRDLARIKFGDFDGNGVTDVYRVEGYGGIVTDKIYLFNNDAQFYSIDGPQTYVGGWIDGAMRDIARINFGDFNGDGRVDIYRIEGYQETVADTIYYFNGNDFLTTRPGPVTDIDGTNAYWQSMFLSRFKFADFNGDGKTDVYQIEGTSSVNGGDLVFYSTGDGFNGPNDGPETIIRSGDYYRIDIGRVHVGDFDGDGLKDVGRVNGWGDSPPLPMDIYYSAGDSPDMLASIETGSGSTIALSYLPSTRYSNISLPFPIQTLSTITVDEAFSSSVTSSYFYSGGYFDREDKEFRGFGYVHQTNPDGTTLETWFHQRDVAGVDDEDFKGKPYRTEAWDSTGSLMSGTDMTWDKVATSQGEYPVFVSLQAKDTTAHIGGVPVTTSQTMYYDSSNGFLTTAIQSGPGAEDVTTEYEYDNNCGDENLWRMIGTTVTGATSGKVRETTLDYETGTGNLLTKTFWNDSGENSVTSFTYTAEGNVETQTDGNGGVTTTWYDSASKTFPERVCLPSTNGVSHCSSAEFDTRYGVPRYFWDENGNKAESVFDEFGRIIETISYEGDGPVVVAKSIAEYHDWEYVNNDSPNYVVSKGLENTDGGNSYIEGREYFDGLGRSIQAVSFGENSQPVVSKTYYDEMGRAERSEGPFFGTGGSGWEYSPPSQYPWAQTTFNDLGMSVTVQTPTGSTTFSYAGLSATVTDPDQRQRKESKDYLGRVTQVTEYGDLGAQYLTSYVYNAAGDLKTVTDHNNNQTVMTYDELGRKTAMTSPDMGSWTYSYDDNGNLKRQTDAKGQSITFEYDELNRVEEKVYSTGQNTVNYTYDSSSITNGKGRLFEVDNQYVVSQVTGYDSLGNPLGSNRIITGDSNTYTTTTEYDLAGRVGKSIYPDGYEVSYTYHTGTPLVSEVKGASSATATPVTLASFSGHDAMGRMGTMQFGNGTSTSYSYDASTTRLQSILSTSSGGTAVNKAYQYTASGLIDKVLDYRMGDVFNLGGAPVEFVYTYDNLARMTGETPSYGFNASSWGYDALGNIDSKVVDGQTWDYTYDPTKVHAVAGVTINSNAYGFSYDSNGNMTSGIDLTDPANPGTRSITWNADNMPTQIVHTGSQTVTSGFLYDGNGVRSRKTDSGGGSTYYIGDHYEITNGTVTRHIFAGGQRIASISGANTRYFHKDHLGSTSAVTDGSGNIVETADYKPFGGMRDYSGSVVTQYKYTDQEFDPESGLYNYNARLYDPALGRFISADTIVQSPFNPQTLNRYSYVGNNPLLYVDPSGHLFGIDDILIGAIVGGVIGGASAEASGGDFMDGFAQGAVSGAIFGGISGVGMYESVVGGPSFQTLSPAGLAGIYGAAGGVAGGIGAEIGGGDFWDGFGVGAVTGGLGSMGWPEYIPYKGDNAFVGQLTRSANAWINGASAGALYAATNGGDIWDGAVQGGQAWVGGDLINSFIGHTGGLIMSGKLPKYTNGSFVYEAKTGDGAITFGNTIIGPPGMSRYPAQAKKFAHELAHTKQYLSLGGAFLPAYAANFPVVFAAHNMLITNFFEHYFLFGAPNTHEVWR